MKLAAQFNPEKTVGLGDGKYDPVHCYLDVNNPSSPVLVSTDGRMLTVIPVVADEGDTSGAIPTRAIEAARCLSENGQMVLRAHSHIKPPEPLVILDRPAMTFPKWREAIPKLGSTTLVFDLWRLVAIAKALGAAEDKPRITLNFEPGESGTFAITVTHWNPTVESGAVGYLMTVRSEEELNRG